MSQTKTLKVATTTETEPPSILEQVLEAMERRDAAQAYKPRPIEINSFAELQQWAEMAAASGMVPKDYVGKPAAIMIAVDMGAELGLKRMQAVQGIAVINGRPSIWGDALWALVLSQSSLIDAREWMEGEGDARVAYCEIKRKGRTPVLKSFSVEEAKRAGLWKTEPKLKKQGRDGSSYEVDSGPWFSYPNRMLQMRARALCARDAYSDALKGFQMAEEVMDYPDETPMRAPAPPPIKMPEPTKPTAAAPSEKTQQTCDALINTIVSCENPDEWLERDSKSAKYREKLKTAHPDLSAAVEEAFASARDRLFPADPMEGGESPSREPGSEG